MGRDRLAPLLRKGALSIKHTAIRSKRILLSFGRPVLNALPVIISFLLITSFLDRMGWFDRFENAALDSIFHVKEPLKANHVVIVGIDEKDYKELFNEQSPLSPKRVRDIIDVIAAGGPRVIGVDLDTSSETSKLFEPWPSCPPIIWGQDARQKENEKSVWDRIKSAWKIFHREEELFEPRGVLGEEAHKSEALSGIARLPQDSDGVVRRYQRTFKTTDSASSGMDSFAWAIVKAYRGVQDHPKASEEEHGEFALSFPVDRSSFKPWRASTILKAPKDEVWQSNGPLTGKIVLLGGLYSAADEHSTPLGRRAGVELMAQAIESDLQHALIPLPNKPFMWMIELLAGICMLFLYQIFRLSRGLMLISFIAIPVLALLFSFAVFSSLMFWARFVLILLAVLIQQLFDHIQEYRKMLLERMHEHVRGFGEHRQEKIANPKESEKLQQPFSKEG